MRVWLGGKDQVSVMMNGRTEVWLQATQVKRDRYLNKTDVA